MILVVGAGPTGLSLAIELARRGVPHRLIEKSTVRS
ncbi:MAG: FAD-dependent monooxygenase, partial [Polyangia bacterium]